MKVMGCGGYRERKRQKIMNEVLKEESRERLEK